MNDKHIIRSEYDRMNAPAIAQYQYERAERLQAELDKLRAATPQTWRGIHIRTLEHGIVHATTYSPSLGVWTADVLYDGDSRLTQVPLSEIEPDSTPEGRD